MSGDSRTAIVSGGDNEMPKPLCAGCEGLGWITVPEHSMYCNGYRCDPELCPVPTQVRCPDCDTETNWPTITTEEPW